MPHQGHLEDVGKSVLICDVCEEMYAKGGTRYQDGDPCPRCEDGDPEPDVIAAANRYGPR